MIGGVGRHGRTKRDSKKLSAHLLKDKGATVEVLNSAAPDLRAAISDMELARDGSRADSAYLHMYLSPSRDMSRDELRQSAEIVMKHFDASDHQAALIFHDKPRNGGEGGSHVHIVLGRIGPEGDVLPAGFEKIRMETAMRLVEYEMGEAPLLGRHHESGVRWMRQNGHIEAAEWLEAAHGPNPLKPASMASPDARQGLERNGIVLGVVRETVTAAWTASDSPKAFAAAIAAEGLSISPGEKSGVWIVRHGDQEIGALDRIVKEKRRDIADKMKGFDHAAAETARPEISTSIAPARGSDLQKGREIAGAAILARSGREDGRRPDRIDTGYAGIDPAQQQAVAPDDRRSAQQSRRIDEAAALKQLSAVRLSPAAIEAIAEIKMRRTRSVPQIEQRQAERRIESSTGWSRLRTLRDDLIDVARRTYDRVVAYRQQQEEERKRSEEAMRLERVRNAIREQQAQSQSSPEPEYVYSGPRM